ncbi:MAG TPA: hypothetical protein VK308_06885 [Pyrinomonadaceae bacterium]|nr:hypothetical protein [Pyrinomonadaceae bacterium]
MKNRKIEIRIEKRERITFFRSPDQIQTVCRICARESVFIAPKYAVASFDMTMREIFRLVETGRLHYIETESGAAFVCLTSLETLTVNQIEVVCQDDRTEKSR